MKDRNAKSAISIDVGVEERAEEAKSYRRSLVNTTIRKIRQGTY